MRNPRPTPFGPYKMEHGIGRKLSDADFSTFMETLHKILPRGMRFNPRELPGVTYIGSKDLTYARDHESPDIGLATLPTEDIVPALCAKGILKNVTAFKTPSFDIVRVRRKDARSAQIQIQVADTPSAHYDSGYLLKGEKLAAMMGLGLNLETPPNKATPSMFMVKMGLLVNGDYAAIDARLPEIGAALGRSVLLDPIGLVSAE